MSLVQRTITLPVLLAVSIFIAVFFTSCADRIKTDLNVYKALDESLINSNKIINAASEQEFRFLQDKMSDPASSEKAKPWYPKAKLIQELSEDVYNYIERLKTDLKKEAGLKSVEGTESFREADKNAVIRLFNKNSKGNELYERLQKYKTDVLAVDSGMLSTFENTLLITTQAFESGQNNQQDFTKTIFDDIPVIAAIAMLSKFQNNVKIIENKTVAFCNSKVASYDSHGYYSSYSIFAAISSGCVKAKEEIEITAGIAAFSKLALPIVIINGKNVPLDEIGAAIYKFKASDKPGKHIVPVEISFTDQDGQKQTVTKNIEYTVAN
jgi:gliding motility-associated protein GldM